MYVPGKSFIQDIDKSKLIAMREQGMSNKEIASELKISYSSVHSLIGAQPKEMTSRNRAEGMRKDKPTEKPSKQAQEVEAQRNVALVMKPVAPSPIPLHGYFMDYFISADRKTIDVETEDGRCLMQIPADQLDTFIRELNAIKNNISNEKPGNFWA